MLGQLNWIAAASHQRFPPIECTDRAFLPKSGTPCKAGAGHHAWLGVTKFHPATDYHLHWGECNKGQATSSRSCGRANVPMMRDGIRRHSQLLPCLNLKCLTRNLLNNRTSGKKYISWHCVPQHLSSYKLAGPRAVEHSTSSWVSIRAVQQVLRKHRGCSAISIIRAIIQEAHLKRKSRRCTFESKVRRDALPGAERVINACEAAVIPVII